MQRIARVLSNSGYHVTMVGRTSEDFKEIQSSDYDLKRYRCLFNKGPLFYLEINCRFVWAFLFQKFDLIYAVDNDTLPSGIILKWLKRVPLIFDSHEWFSEVPELEGSVWKKKIWKWVGIRGAKNASICITVSKALAGQLGKETGCRFEVIRNVPVWYPEEPRPKRSDKPLIIYQGALNKGRGLEELVYAIRDLPDWICWLVGEGDLSESLRSLVDALNLNERVVFLGRKGPSELRIITPKAWVGYNLLEPASKSYYFSLANKFFDYMHAGVPSLNSPFPEYEKILSQYPTGRVCSKLDRDHIQNILKKEFASVAAVESYEKDCAKASAVFNWQKEASALVELINEMD
jgi:glycosyltransferase involved in cell wall biosynthesis